MLNKTLKECILEAESSKTAIGHFNISSTDALQAIVRAAEKVGVPVIIGVSEGERDYVGVKMSREAVDVVKENAKVPVFLNADHTYSFERVVEAVDAGFDSVIIDGAQLSLKENIALTKKAVDYARSKNSNVLIEGEIGYIGTSSKILKEIPEGAATTGHLTSPEDAETFVRESGVDLLAPAVGNIHGMLIGAENPNLDIELITKIRKSAGVPLVLHGGSGTSDRDFVSAIKAGISIVHINTEIRLAYTQGIKLYFSDNPDDVTPYKYLKAGAKALEAKVEQRLRLFSGK